MEEYWAANQYGGTDAGSIYNKKVQELLMELGGGEEVYGNCAALVGEEGKDTDQDPSVDYWGHTQQAKMNKETMGFTYLGIAVVHYRLRLISVTTGYRTALLREHMTGSAEDNPRILTVIRANKTGEVYFLLLFPPESTCKRYDPRNPLKTCTLDNNLRTNQDFDIMKVSNLKVTKVEGAERGFTSTGSETFYLEDPNVRDRQGHHRMLEMSALLPGHATDLNDPGDKIESSICDIVGRKAVYDLLRAMVDTGTIPANFPSLSLSSVAAYDKTQESLSSLWNSSASIKGEYNNVDASLWNSATRLECNNMSQIMDNNDDDDDDDDTAITRSTSRSLSGGSYLSKTTTRTTTTTTEVTTAATSSLSVPFAGLVVADDQAGSAKEESQRWGR